MQRLRSQAGRLRIRTGKCLSLQRSTASKIQARNSAWKEAGIFLIRWYRNKKSMMRKTSFWRIGRGKWARKTIGGNCLQRVKCAVRIIKIKVVHSLLRINGSRNGELVQKNLRASFDS